MNTNFDSQMRDKRIGSAARLNEARDSSSDRDEAVRSVSVSASTGLRWYDRVAALPRNSLPAAHCVQRQATRAPLLSVHKCTGIVCQQTWLFRICDFLGKHFSSPCGSVAATARALEERIA